MGEQEASNDDLNARGLWQIATELIDAKLFHQAIQVLETLSQLQVHSERLLVAHAKILLSETFIIHCKSTYSYDKIQEFSQPAQLLVQNARQCIQSLPVGHLETHWLVRLMKAEYLALTMSNQNKITCDRQILDAICNAFRVVKENMQNKNVHEYEKYFMKRLCLFFKQTNEDLLLESTDYTAHSKAFQENLTHARSFLPQYIDSFMELWLVEVSCHGMVVDPSGTQEQDDNRVRQALQMCDKVSRSVLVSCSASSSEISSTLSAGGLRIYHLIINCFYLLRQGEIKQLANRVVELKEICEKFKTQYPETKGIWTALHVQNMIDLFEVKVLSCQDPCEAVVRSTNGILRVQTSLQHYNETSNIGVQLMLIVIIFDFLIIHCQLQVDQGHYSKMRNCLAEAATLMQVYKPILEKWVLYGPLVAQIHAIVAKYASITGEIAEAIRHLQIAAQMIPPIEKNDVKTYPERYLSVWISILDTSTYCINGSLLRGSQNTPLTITPMYPDNRLLHFAANIMENSSLRDRMGYCSSYSMRAKYDLSIVRWLCATEDASRTNYQENFQQYVSLENQRSNLVIFFQQALERANTYVGCSNTVAEFMALYGSKMIALGNIENGTNTLKNALKVSSYTRNTLLQIRLMVTTYEFYAGHSTESQATAAQKHHKKCVLLHESINQALSDISLHKLVLRI